MGRNRIYRKIEDLLIPLKPRTGSRRAGYVYAIKFGDRYKLGRTSSPSGRIDMLQSQFRQSFDTYHFIAVDDMYEAERALFGMYAAQREELEWFRLTPEQYQEICQFSSFYKGQFRV